MRSIVSLAFVAFVVASLSCGSSTTPTGSGSSGSSGGQGSQTQSLTATINNIPWVANGSITATYSPVTNNVSAASLTVVAADSPFTQTLGFAVSPTLPGTPLTAGTYLVGTTPTNGNLTIGLATMFVAAGSTGSGSVTLSTLNTTTKTATGTFTFTLQQTTGALTRTVTNGAFSVRFQ